MKKALLIIAAFLFAQALPAQLLKKLGDKVKKEVDKTADKIMGNEPAGTKADSSKTTTGKAGSGHADATENLTLYAAYDFVPGDSVLFSDELTEEEENEIPSKWLLDRGRAEIVSIDGEKLIAGRSQTTLRPRMKPNANYLPKRFTIEFDIKHVKYVWNYGRSISLNFVNESLDKNADAGDFKSAVTIWASGSVTFGKAKGEWPIDMREPAADAVLKGWKHVAISVNERSVKVYINQYRIMNAQVEFGVPSSLQFAIDNDYDAPVLIKNFRIMAGGKNPVKQVTTEKLYIARGILFERASPTLKPESMGELNALVKLMKEDPAVKFEIAGHTSTEAGSSAEANQALSEARARAVREKMIDMGIDGSRLQAKGYGQTKPMATNDTPEGRATNRRVEFRRL